MPSTSEKQKKFMKIACHNKEFAEKNGIDQKVACEFVRADEEAEKKKKKKKKELKLESLSPLAFQRPPVISWGDRYEPHEERSYYEGTSI